MGERRPDKKAAGAKAEAMSWGAPPGHPGGGRAQGNDLGVCGGAGVEDVGSGDLGLREGDARALQGPVPGVPWLFPAKRRRRG